MKISDIQDEHLRKIVEFANLQGWHTTLYNNEEGQFRIKIAKHPTGEDVRKGGLKIMDAIEKNPEIKKEYDAFLAQDTSFYSPYHYKLKKDSLILSMSGMID